MIVVNPGPEHKVLESLIKFEGVEVVSLVYGEFDIHVKVLVESMENLREVHDKVRKLRILTSETLIAYERAPRKKRSIRNNHVRRLSHKQARH